MEWPIKLTVSKTDPAWKNTEWQLTVETTETSSIIRNPTKVKENIVMNSLKPARCSFSSVAGSMGPVIVLVSIDCSLDAAMMC